MSTRFLRPRAAGAAVLLALLAACSDGERSPVAPEGPRPPGGAVAALECRADLRARTLGCDDALSVPGISADWIIGGQGVYVRLTSANVAYDSLAQVFSADVTVQNLLAQRMGSDGQTVSGIKVFFHSGPSATDGSGQVSVRNEDGEDLFTRSGQPYFHYTAPLPPGATSPAKRWEWSVPRSAKAFAFTVYVWTPLVPAVVFDRDTAFNIDLWRVGIDGNDRTRLTTHALDDLDATVARGRVVFTSYRDGNPDLYAMPLMGGTVTRLTSTATFDEGEPALSRDGSRLAFARAPKGGMTRLYIANPDATSPTQPTASQAPASTIETSPAWKDATTLAFTSTANGNADLWTAAPPAAPALLSSSTRADVEAAWNSDGTKVAFASNRSGRVELFVLDVTSGTTTQVTNTRAAGSLYTSFGAPTWLADGRIVSTCFRSGIGSRLCWIDPAAAVPAPTEIDTGPGDARRPAAILF